MGASKKSLTIPVGSIRLEARLGCPEGHRGGPGVVICHPHPQFGGSMENNVVWALFEELARRGYLPLAFNFRGVGASQGMSEGGEAEVNDVIGVLDWLASLPETKPFGVGVVGYSFGAWVGLRAAARDDRIRCAGAIAPPVSMYSFGFLAELEVPLSVVSGDQDPFCSPTQRGDLLAILGKQCHWALLEGADHFFWGYEAEAAQRICEDFLEWLPPGAPP